MIVASDEVLERERQALELRRAGHTFTHIAKEIGTDRSYACKIVRRALARPNREITREVIELEATRLDKLQTAHWDNAVAGDYDALKAVLAIMERRAKLLGLDHSSKVAEAQLALEADKVRLIALAFGKALDTVELTPEQRDTMTATLLGELRAHTDDPDPDPDPDDDGEDGEGGDNVVALTR